MGNMKVLILAGGMGTRLAEETQVIPKPMVEVGDKPLLHHIMDIYMKYGYNDFVISAGYKYGHILAYFASIPDIKFVQRGSQIWEYYNKDFHVLISDTGQDCLTGGRIYKVKDYLTDTFMMTYGDGLANVDISQLLHTHDVSNHSVTVTAVHPPSRFGNINIDSFGNVLSFDEKPVNNGWINGGFFVIEKIVLESMELLSQNINNVNFEKDFLSILADGGGDVDAYCHNGFWMCVDTYRDLLNLREIYNKQGAVWLNSGNPSVS